MTMLCGTVLLTVAVKATLPLIVAPAAGVAIVTTGEGAGAGFGETAAVCAEVDEFEPYVFEAVTVTRTV
jgi:hypothetical protein